MWKSKQHFLSMPFVYNCICPQVSCQPKDIFLKFCFVNFEYKRTITLKNETDIFGYISFTPEKNNSPIHCELSRTEIFLNGSDIILIEVTIKTTELGTHQLPLT